MTVLEKIKRCVSLVWDFQEIYGEEDIEDFCRNELRTYPQHDEIMKYFKHVENLEKDNEWHYVKDELPDHNGQFYVAIKGNTETFILNYDYDEYDESKMVWLDDDDTNFDNEVYAWHEKLKAPKENA